MVEWAHEMNGPPPPAELIAPLLISLILAIAGGVVFGRALADWRLKRPSTAGTGSLLGGALALGWSAVLALRLPREFWRYPAAVSSIWLLAWIMQRLPRGAKRS